MGKRIGKRKKRERRLDQQYGKKRKIYVISTAVGPMFATKGERIAVRIHNRITTVPVEELTPDMHVVCHKEILSHLTLEDVHNDLMNSKDIDAAKYRVAHKLLHDHPSKGSGLPLEAEIPVLRKLILRHFDPNALESEWVPEELKQEDKFYEKLFKVDGEDFSKKVYREISKYIRNKIPEEKRPSSEMLLHWLKGNVTMPDKIETLREVAKALNDPEIEELANLKDAGEYWSGRRAALMAYIAKMSGKSIGAGGKWRAPKSAMREIETLLRKRIKEKQKGT